jgi:hypothetical protein
MTGCNCSKKSEKSVNMDSFIKPSIVISDFFLEGEFTRMDGVKFTASMSAKGNGSDCTTSEKSAKKNIFRTLQNFLDSYSPKIIDYKYTIQSKCYL